MSKRSLPSRHPLSGAALRPIGYRKNGRPIWPILGGSEPPNQPPSNPPVPTPPGPPTPPPNQPPPSPSPPPDKGFPENTPLVEMSVEQREAYHRYHSRKWQERAEARADYDQQKADADRWREFQQSQQTPSERQIQEAREAGKAEAAAAANAEQVQNLLRVSLSARGVTAEDLEDLVTAANPAAFITDGKVSADKVSTYASRLAGGSNTGGGGGGRPDLGQGRREGGGKPSVSSGRDLFAERNKPRQTA